MPPATDSAATASAVAAMPGCCRLYKVCSCLSFSLTVFLSLSLSPSLPPFLSPPPFPSRDAMRQGLCGGVPGHDRDINDPVGVFVDPGGAASPGSPSRSWALRSLPAFKRKENVTNDLGPTGGWGEATYTHVTALWLSTWPRNVAAEKIK